MSPAPTRTRRPRSTRASCALAATLVPLSLLYACGGGGSHATTTPDAATSSSADAAPTASVTGDPIDYLTPDDTCSFACDPTCEPNGYTCSALAAYDTLPHATSCGAWNGTFPAVKGYCAATTPTGFAADFAGPSASDPTTLVLPTGQRVHPTGKESVFTDFEGGFPTNVITVPGTSLVVVVDGGIDDESVRLVDTTLIGSTTFPVVGSEKFEGNQSVDYGAAIVPTPASDGTLRLYISGGGGGLVYGYTIDPVAKTLTHTAANDITLAHLPADPGGGGVNGNYLISGLAVSGDGKRLAVGTGNNKGGSPLFVLDVDPTSATFTQTLAHVVLASDEIFGVAFHPSDPTGQYVYATIWDGGRVDIVDTASSAVRSINLGKNPEAILPLGPRYFVVASADADEIGIVDTLSTTTSEIVAVALGTAGARGYAPSTLAYDATASRLYVTLAGVNLVAAFDVTLSDSAPPTLAPAGALRSDWWPSGVTVLDDGSVAVVNGKGRGIGGIPTQYSDSQVGITESMHGSIQIVATPDAALLASEQAANDAVSDRSQLPGVSTVNCGPMPYDFPVPLTNTTGPSTLIQHIVFVVKENKSFDGVFGDVAGLKGAAADVYAPGQMQQLFPNQRKVAAAFTTFENYYTSAEQSIQGHVWTSFGRTTDFVERTWLVSWGRGLREPIQGVDPVGRPIEGSVFDWLTANDVDYDDMGEIIGANAPLDSNYPGEFYALDVPDTQKDCYMVARARTTCDLKAFTYAVQPNDHTSGLDAGEPTPETFVAVGDEGIGILIEGLSQSPLWASTLVIVTEDDPQDTADHIDAHRTPLYMASPWIKRGYVSDGHYDTSSLHKLYANLLGKPYPNEVIATAPLPLDAFTSTPDFTPFTHIPRSYPVACNPSGTPGAATVKMSAWDLSKPDEAPGLSEQVWAHFHQGKARPASPGSDPDGDGDDD